MNHAKQSADDVELQPLHTNKKAQETQSDELPCKDFDDIIDIIGSQGKYQKFLLYAILCPITTLEPFFTLNTIFMLFIPDHWCHVPGRGNTTLDEWRNLTLPKVVGPDGALRYDQCNMFGDNGSLLACPNGWEFDKTDYESTIPSDFNWVCSNGHYAYDAFTLAAVGNAVGTLVFGHCADKFGRKPIFFLTCFINIFFRSLSLFIPQHVTAFMIVQFLTGTAFPVMFIAPSMIAAEICDKEYRAWVYAVTWMIWVVGMAGLPLIAWLCRTWFLIGILTSIPGFFLFLYYRMVPESPRWLLSVGRIQESAAVLMDIAKTNGTDNKVTYVQLVGTLHKLNTQQSASNDKNIGAWTLFSRFRLARNTLLLTLSWSMNILVYYGITLNTTNMAGDQFVNFFILSIIELPAGWLGGVLVEKVGRRWTQVGFFFMCMLACFVAAIGISFRDLTPLVNTFVVVAKFAVTLTFLVVYLQGTEIFPTQLRSTGSGFASTIGAAMGILGPYMVYLGKLHSGGPYFAMGTFSLFGIIASAFLPETLRQNLPETLEDADTFGKDNKFWSLYPKPKNAPEESNCSKRSGCNSLDNT